MMQTVAVAVDTSHALRRIHAILPTILVTVSEHAKLSAPWMDTFVTLTCSTSASATATEFHGGGHNNNLQVQVACRAEFKQSSEGLLCPLDTT
eukprot:CAMPEP_0176150554 /NCGR_PEP_ID=MMETSP0120_2-20121206/76870_1 /TAXON_ID=160619 /ORGANISM="Kryptoperidinium foliaceum, Strain CCMP 1326" /LENGTH=92 /DNA_ID=CAMNT_0017487473 /DNA_START=33 /DNA_END=307 /DNA_ORIENTATION=-